MCSEGDWPSLEQVARRGERRNHAKGHAAATVKPAASKPASASSPWGRPGHSAAVSLGAPRPVVQEDLGVERSREDSLRPEQASPNLQASGAPQAAASKASARRLPHQGPAPKGRASRPRAAQVQHLVEMGFSEQAAERALHECVWDVNEALDWLDKHGSSLACDLRGKLSIEAFIERTDGGSRTASTASTPRAEGCPWSTSRQSTVTSASLRSTNSVLSWDGEEADASSDSCAKADSEAADIAPRLHRPINRAGSAWVGEDESQLSVQEGDFLRVWADTRTDSGWVYAEQLTAGNELGWVPYYVLHELPSHQLWMRVLVTAKASHETQLAVCAGDVVAVVPNTRTPEGWVYAEAAATVRNPSLASERETGWVPESCLEWPQEG